MAYIGGKLSPWFSNEPNDRAMRNMVRIGVTEAASIAAKNTPVETGHLREEWKTTVAIKVQTFLGVGWSARWENSVEYAIYVNEGTGLYGPEHRKYLILPKTPGGKLHWVDRLSGEDVYANAVMHPGSPGNYMLQISANVLEAQWTRLVRPALRNWAREVENQNDSIRVRL